MESHQKSANTTTVIPANPFVDLQATPVHHLSESQNIYLASAGGIVLDTILIQATLEGLF